MVTTVVNDTSLVAGAILDRTGMEIFSCTKATGVLTRGDVVIIDQSASPPKAVLKTAGAVIYGPFGVVQATVVSGAPAVSVAKGGTHALRSTGTIKFGADVGMSATVDGSVDPFTATNIATTLTDTGIETAILDRRRVVGESEGFADSYKRGAQVQAVTGDLVAVNMNKGY